MHLPIVLGLFVAVSILAACVVWVFRKAWKTDSQVRSGAMSALLTMFSLAYLCLALEAYFYCFGAQSEGYNFTLASKRWFARYSGPPNTLGYRDDEHTPEDFVGKKVLFAVGDSFTWGSGIRNRADRFSNVLARKLGNGWAVANIAVGGWDTVDELNGLKAYPYKPDTVILQYFVNDAKSAARKHGLGILPEVPAAGALIQPMVDRSDLCNRVYWNLWRVKLKERFENHWKNMKRCYTDEAIWQEHKEELREFVQYTREKHIELLVVIFPNLTALEESRPITAKVAAAFEEMQVEVLDLTSVLAGRNPKDMVCNAFDAHPNEAVHHEAAELLYQRLMASRPNP